MAGAVLFSDLMDEIEFLRDSTRILRMTAGRTVANLIAMLGFAGCISSQALVIESVHRDSMGQVIYLERAYRDADTMAYFMAYSDGGRVLRSFTRSNGDTLIEVLQCHEVVPSSVPELGSMRAYYGDEALVIQTSADSMWVIIPDGSLDPIWDTALTLQQGEQFLDIYRRSAHEYAALVASGQLTIDLSAAHLREVWEYRMLRGHLLSKRILANDGLVTNRQDFRYSGDSLFALSYFGTESVPYAVDSISWSTDSTEMKVVNCWLEDDQRSEYTIHFLGDSSVFLSGGETVVDHWVYDRTPWYVRFREAALREGPLCRSRIQRSGECLLRASCASTGNCSRNEHVWMPDGRLLETVVFRNGRFERSITYSYP